MNETSPQLDPAVFEAMGKIAIAVGPLPHHLQVVTLKMATAFVGGHLLSNGNGNVHAFAPAAPAPAALAPAPAPVEVVQVNKVTGKKSSGGSSKSKAAQRARKPGAAPNGAVTQTVVQVMASSPPGGLTAEEVWEEQNQFTKVQIQAALSNHISKTNTAEQKFRKAPKSHKTGPNRYIWAGRR